MEKNAGPFRLVLSSAASKQIEWHCKHYTGRGLMKFMKNGQELAKEMKISNDSLEQTFKKYNEQAKSKSDEFGTKFFLETPYRMDDTYYVAIVCPVVHYCMGGLKIDTDSAVLDKNNKPIAGLFATGELCGGVHGLNRLGGSSLLDCVVFGRVSGASVAKYLLQNVSSTGSGSKVNFTVDPSQNSVTFSWNKSSGSNSTSSSNKSQVPLKDLQEEKENTTTPTTGGSKVYTREEVAKHTSDKDCWVIVNGQVLDVTTFLSEHPGGKDSIMLFAGKEASEEFNMIHKPDVIGKYAPQCIIGTIAGGSVSHGKTSMKMSKL
jgi:succinate dehydrogenase/fumarate reductase flavoprotein subunit